MLLVLLHPGKPVYGFHIAVRFMGSTVQGRVLFRWFVSGSSWAMLFLNPHRSVSWVPCGLHVIGGSVAAPALPFAGYLPLTP